jgi:hypothetical protein
MIDLTKPLLRQSRYQYVVEALLEKSADGVTGRAVPALLTPLMYAPEMVPPVRTMARTSPTVPTTSRIVELLVPMKVDEGWEKRKEVARGGGGGAEYGTLDRASFEDLATRTTTKPEPPAPPPTELSGPPPPPEPVLGSAAWPALA